MFGNYPGAPRPAASRTQPCDSTTTSRIRRRRRRSPARTPTRGATSTTPPSTRSSRPSDRRGGRSRHIYPFDDFTRPSNDLGECDAGHPVLVGRRRRDSSWETNREQNAVQAFWSVNRFHDHLAAAPIGFDAASGQLRGARRHALARADRRRRGRPTAASRTATHLNNANMFTPPDGQSPVMQMYLFAAPHRRARSATSTAATTRRSSTTSTRTGSRTASSPTRDRRGRAEHRAVGGDGRGLERLVRQGLPRRQCPGARHRGRGEIDMGAYVDPPRHSIRTRADRLPGRLGRRELPGHAASAPGGYTYGDFGRSTAARPEVHADGEIWAETLWDLRDAARLATSRRRSSPAGCGSRRRSRRSSTSATRSCRPTGRLRRHPRRRALGRVRAPRHGLRRRRPPGPTDPTRRSRRFDAAADRRGAPASARRRRRDAAGGPGERRRGARGSCRGRPRRVDPLDAPAGARRSRSAARSACRATATMTVTRATRAVRRPRPRDAPRPRHAPARRRQGGGRSG